MFDGGESKFVRHGRHRREPNPGPSFLKNQVVIRGRGLFVVVEQPKKDFRRAWIRSVTPGGVPYGIRIYESFDSIRIATEQERKDFGLST